MSSTRQRAMKWPVILTSTMMLLAIPALSQPRPEVIDGDTLRLNGVTWRLHGIDAPEAKQTCADGWWAGQEAHRALGRIVWTRKVECEEIAKDRYGRSVGRCTADGEDIGTQMVREGYAWAFTRYSWKYLPEEWLARWDGLGVHKRECARPWDWRTAKRH